MHCQYILDKSRERTAENEATLKKVKEAVKKLKDEKKVDLNG